MASSIASTAAGQDYGPRARGMSGAVVASETGPAALLLNPGGLSFQQNLSLQLSTSVYVMEKERTKGLYNVDLYDGKYKADETSSRSGAVPGELLLALPVPTKGVWGLTVAMGMVVPGSLETSWESRLLSEDGRAQVLMSRELSTMDVRAVAGVSIRPLSWLGLGVSLEALRRTEYYLWTETVKIQDDRLYYSSLMQSRDESRFHGLAATAGLQASLANDRLRLGATLRTRDIMIEGHKESWSQKLLADNLYGELSASPVYSESFYAGSSDALKGGWIVAVGACLNLPGKLLTELDWSRRSLDLTGDDATNEWALGVDLLYLRPLVLRFGAAAQIKPDNFDQLLEGRFVGGQSGDFYSISLGTGIELQSAKGTFVPKSVDVGAAYSYGDLRSVALVLAPWDRDFEFVRVKEAPTARHGLTLFFSTTVEW